MPIKFDIYPNPPRKEDTETPTYHARIIADGMVSEDTFAGEISRASSLTPGDILAVLTELRSSMVTHLREGKRIHLSGIGYFEMAIDSPDIESDAPNFPSKRLKIKTVKFQPEKELKRDVSFGLEFERVKYLKHSITRDEKEDILLLRDAFKSNDRLTSKQITAVLGYTRSKTYRVMNQLREQKMVDECGFKTAHIYSATPKLYDDQIEE